MKEYLPILERLFYAVAFFVFGYVVCTSRHEPCLDKNDIKVVYKRDTLRLNTIVHNKETLYKYITKVDSLMIIVNDTVFSDSNKLFIKDHIIEYQDTIISNQKFIIDTLEVINKNINNQIDTCVKNNAVLINQFEVDRRQIKKDQRNKTILGGVLVVLTAVLSNFIIK